MNWTHIIFLHHWLLDSLCFFKWRFFLLFCLLFSRCNLSLQLCDFIFLLLFGLLFLLLPSLYFFLFFTLSFKGLLSKSNQRKVLREILGG